MSTKNLRDTTIQSLRNEIHEGNIKKGEIITESDLCKRFGVSRTPAREALIELTANGVLTKVPGKGYQICELSQKAQLEAYELIACLDGMAAKLAIPRLTEADFVHMSEILDMIDVAVRYKNFKKYYELQQEFHRVYETKCGNDQVQKNLERAKSSVDEYWDMDKEADETFRILGQVNLEHREMLRLFRAGDACALRNYIEDVHWADKEF